MVFTIYFNKIKMNQKEYIRNQSYKINNKIKENLKTKNALNKQNSNFQLEEKIIKLTTELETFTVLLTLAKSKIYIFLKLGYLQNM